MPALAAHRHAAKDAFPHMVIGPVVPAAPAQVFLRPLEQGLVHQRRVGVLGHRPLVPWDGRFFLGLDADLFALAQHGVPQVHLVFQDAFHRGVVPQIGRPSRPLLAELVPVQHPVLQRGDDAVGVQVQGDLSGGIPCRRPLENALHHWGGHLIGGQAVLVLPVLAVAVGRAGAVLAALPLASQHVLDLPGAVPEVDLVHGEQEGSHDVIMLRVEVVRDGDILDAVLREELLRVVAGLPHITAQPGQVLGDNQVGLALLQLFQHLLEAGAIEVAAGVAVVHKFPDEGDAVLLAIVFNDHPLIGDTGRFPALGLLVGEPQVGEAQCESAGFHARLLR